MPQLETERAKPDLFLVGAPFGGLDHFQRLLWVTGKVWMPPVAGLDFFKPMSPRARALHLLGRFALLADREWRTALTSKAPPDMESVSWGYELCWSGELDWDSYQRLIQGPAERSGPILIAEASETYLSLGEDDLARLAARLPRCRAVLLLRAPHDQLWAALRATRGWKTLLADEIGLKAFLANARPGYSAALGRWRKALGSERVHCLFYDHLLAGAGASFDGLGDFLGLGDLNLDQIPDDAVALPSPLPNFLDAVACHCLREMQDLLQTYPDPIESWIAAMVGPRAK